MFVVDLLAFCGDVVTIGAAELVGNWDVVKCCTGLCAMFLCRGEGSSSSASEVSSSLSSLIDAGMSSLPRRDLSAVGLVGLACLPFFELELLEGNSHCLLPLRHP